MATTELIQRVFVLYPSNLYFILTVFNIVFCYFQVTWHGKGNEDKRGRSVSDGVSARSWLYVAGKPVICTRVMEVAALVSSINPTLTPTIDVHEVALMQHRLLWLLYDKGLWKIIT